MDNLGDMRRTHSCGVLNAKDVGTEVVLMGWVLRRRDHGGVIFVDLRDREGITQVVFNPQRAPEAHARAEAIRSEFVLGVRGRVAPRPEGMLQPEPADRRHRGHGERAPDPQHGPDAALPDRGRRGGGGGHAPEAPAPRPAAARGCSATCSLRHQASVAVRTYLNSRGLPGPGNPVPHQEHARGRARLPGPEPRQPGHVLRPAAVAAALQTAVHGRRASTATTRSCAASGTRTCARTASRSSPRSTSRCPSWARRT